MPFKQAFVLILTRSGAGVQGVNRWSFSVSCLQQHSEEPIQHGPHIPVPRHNLGLQPADTTSVLLPD